MGIHIIRLSNIRLERAQNLGFGLSTADMMSRYVYGPMAPQFSHAPSFHCASPVTVDKPLIQSDQ